MLAKRKLLSGMKWKMAYETISKPVSKRMVYLLPMSDTSTGPKRLANRLATKKKGVILLNISLFVNFFVSIK